MLRLDPSTPPLTWGEVFVDGDWCPGREEEASAQQSLQHKTTCLPTLASCLPPYATPSCSCSLAREEGCELGFSDCLQLLFSATSLS